MGDRKNLLAKYRSYFYGEMATLHAGFLARFKDPQVTTPLSLQSFVSQNEIRAIIEKRVSLVPLEGMGVQVYEADGKKPDSKLSDWLTQWLEGAHFGEGRSFVDFAAEVLLCLELDGEVALKLILRNGIPMVRRIPDEALHIVTDPDNVYEVKAFEATWSRTIEGEDSQQEVQIKETIDAKQYVFEANGNTETQPHPFGFIPVILFKREDVEGSPHGRSGVSDLTEPQDNLNRCLTNIARANKYGPWGLYCTEESGAPLPEGDVTVAPGSLVATPIRKVSGDGAADCLFREKEELLDAMYRVAGISRNKADEMAQTSQTSGKAMVILNSQGRRYVSNLLARLRRGYGRLFANAMVMAGKIQSTEQVKVDVSFPSLDQEDPAVEIARAQMLFSAGIPSEALRVMGYEKQKVEELLDERESPEASLKKLQDMIRPDYDA
jgi:hypothetical protein